MNFERKKALKKCLKMTHTTLFDQNKLVFKKIEAILNPELENCKKIKIIGSLRFHFKVVLQVAFKKNENILGFTRFMFFFGFIWNYFTFHLWITCMI